MPPVAPATAAAHAKRICEFLVRENLIQAEQYELVLRHVQQTNERVEDVIVDLNTMPEQELLKALATQLRTRFVTTEKLSKAEIDKSTLDLIPRRFAEHANVFPVLFDARTQTLSVVAADPDDPDLLDKVKMASHARDVKAFLARPAAVKAVIAKFYGGNIHAFALLDRQAHVQFQSMLDQYHGGNMVNDPTIAAGLEKSGGERTITEAEMSRGGSQQQLKSTYTGDEMLALMNVMVSLLEASRADLRGHSPHVARLMRQMVVRMKIVPPADVAIVAAAYLHDLGKMGQYHLTPLNVSEYDGHKVSAVKVAGTPARLIEGVRVAQETLDSISQMYERYDGNGFPSGTSGKDIPLGARLLAICDTYSDLTQNPRNPYRKTLSPAEATAVLVKYRETVFDPHLVDLFRHMIMGDDIRAKLLENRYNALIVDVDPEETTVLELRMIEQGFVVRTARSADAALALLTGGEIDIVISELELPGTDGLKLLAHARAQSWGKDLPWVVYTRRQKGEDAKKAVELGVTDYVAKPASTDVLVVKLKAILDQRATKAGSRGVSGSLKEMGLADMVQVLWHGKKGGNLKIRSGGTTGEIHLVDGNVVNALWGELRGEEAFYEMLKLAEGEFGLDPAYKVQARLITMTSEQLLLEGMRRLDES